MNRIRKVIAVAVFCFSAYYGVMAFALLQSSDPYSRWAGMLVGGAALGGVLMSAAIAFTNFNKSESKTPWWMEILGLCVLIVAVAAKGCANP